jgi:hypothetical protein
MDPSTPIITKNANKFQAVYMVSMGSLNKFNYTTEKNHKQMQVGSPITPHVNTSPKMQVHFQAVYHVVNGQLEVVQSHHRRIFITIQVWMTAGKRKQTNKQTLQVGQSCPQLPAHNAGLPKSFFNSDT